MPSQNRNSIETLLVRSGVERRPVVLGAAAILFAAVFVLRQLGSSPTDGWALLYVLPVALIALELGLVAGLVAAGLATGLVIAWNVSAEAGLSAVGIVNRAVVFTSIGLIAGRFSDRMLAMIGLQAEAARENLRLLERERQRVKQLQLVFEGQEKERSTLAYELHEEAAQALAAVLLGLDALARECSGDSARRVKGVREQVELTLDRCRQLAVALRPPVLDGIGLVPALGGLEELPEVERVSVDPELAGVGLPADKATAVYRAVEEAVRSVAGPCDAAIGLEHDDRELRVSVRPLARDAVISELGPLQARLDLIGGSLESGPQGLLVRIPLNRQSAVALPAPGVVDVG